MTIRVSTAGSFAIPIRFTVGTGEAQDDAAGRTGRDAKPPGGIPDAHPLLR
jgi:hypothetical protein